MKLWLNVTVQEASEINKALIARICGPGCGADMQRQLEETVEAILGTANFNLYKAHVRAGHQITIRPFRSDFEFTRRFTFYEEDNHARR